MDLLFEITVDLICSNEALSKRDATHLHEAVEESAVTPLPQPVRALKFPGLSRDLEALALTGRLAADSHTHDPWTQFVAQIPLGSEAGVSPKQALTSNLLSVEFLRTVEGWSEKSDVAIVIIRFIPEEAQLHMSIVRKHGTPSYILTYAAPATRKRLHFNNLNYYSIPELPHNWVAPLWAEGAAWGLGRRLILRMGKETKPNMDEDSGDGFDRMEHLMEGRASDYMVSSSESESEVK
ncbi:hypothetical protein ACKVV7_005784 [Pyricularia oryzae]